MGLVRLVLMISDGSKGLGTPNLKHDSAACRWGGVFVLLPLLVRPPPSARKADREDSGTAAAHETALIESLYAAFLGLPLGSVCAGKCGGSFNPAALRHQGCDKLFGFASRLCNEVSHNLGL